MQSCVVLGVVASAERNRFILRVYLIFDICSFGDVEGFRIQRKSRETLKKSRVPVKGVMKALKGREIYIK